MNDSRLADGLLPFGLALLTVAAWAVYAQGLLAPLTPSDGLPTGRHLASYAGCPALLLAFVARASTNRVLRLLGYAQLSLLVAFTAWLLSLQSGLWQRLF